MCWVDLVIDLVLGLGCLYRWVWLGLGVDFVGWVVCIWVCWFLSCFSFSFRIGWWLLLWFVILCVGVFVVGVLLVGFVLISFVDLCHYNC